uniref:DUF8040 domain-containing protein n=1 Tax=Davidia involucrata TaxID=16924 RepID=A0A5B7BYA8_DAVIN
MLTNIMYVGISFMLFVRLAIERHHRHHVLRSRSINRVHTQLENLDRLINGGDIVCVEQLRMNRYIFGMLCSLFRTIGMLEDSRHVTVEEQVALFLHVLAHHVKN